MRRVTLSDVPAGWYANPADNGASERFWDGTSWTVWTRSGSQHVTEPAPAAATASADEEPIPAGWYPDPDTDGATARYWDGDDWTERTRASLRPTPGPLAGRRSIRTAAAAGAVATPVTDLHNDGAPTDELPVVEASSAEVVNLTKDAPAEAVAEQAVAQEAVAEEAPVELEAAEAEATEPVLIDLVKHEQEESEDSSSVTSAAVPRQERASELRRNDSAGRGLDVRWAADAEAVDAYRQIEFNRLELLLGAVWDAAMKGDVDSVQAATRLIEIRTRLMGIDLNAPSAPTPPPLLVAGEQQH